MSGHSKWHNIQKTKGAQDAKRAQAFTKIAREMIVAVKEGGSGDPNNNSRLAAVIAKAKAANMPNDNIKRTIDKGACGSRPSNGINYDVPINLAKATGPVWCRHHRRNDDRQPQPHRLRGAPLL